MELQRVSLKDFGRLEEFFIKEHDSTASAEIAKQDTSYRSRIYDFIERPRAGVFKKRQGFSPFVVIRNGDIKAAVIVCSREDNHCIKFLATKTSERGQGYASLLVNYILQNFPFRKIVLKCKPELVKFYERFQFKVVREDYTKNLVAMENQNKSSQENTLKAPFYVKSDPPEVSKSLLRVLDVDLRVDQWEKARVIVNPTDYLLRDFHTKIVFENDRFYNVVLNHLKNSSMITSKWNLGALSRATKKLYTPDTVLLSKGMEIPPTLFINGKVIVKPRDSYDSHGITIVDKPITTSQDSICQVFQEPFLFVGGPFAKRKFDIRALVYVSAAGVFLFNTVYMSFTARAYDNKSVALEINIAANRLQGDDDDLITYMSFGDSPIGNGLSLDYDHIGDKNLQILVREQLVEILCDLFYLTEIAGQRLIEQLFGGVYTGFGIFGLDFILNSRRELKLLEVNSSPGIFYEDKDKTFYEAIFADRFEGSSLKTNPCFTFIPRECLNLYKKKSVSNSDIAH